MIFVVYRLVNKSLFVFICILATFTVTVFLLILQFVIAGKLCFLLFQICLFKNKTTRKYKEYNILSIFYDLRKVKLRVRVFISKSYLPRSRRIAMVIGLSGGQYGLLSYEYGNQEYDY